MFRLIILALLAFAGATDALYSWNSPECQALETQDNSVAESCVPSGSIAGASPACPHCLYDEQCASNWCWSELKVCYTPSLGGCYSHGDHSARCSNCPSDPSTDQSQCSCDNSNFPNNWVDCTDGSGGKFTVDSSEAGSNTYTKKLSSTGGLAADDKFAIVIQCYHNKVREAAGLVPLEWDNGLAKIASDWSEYLCSSGCGLAHSTSSFRDNSGENLYASWSSNALPVSGTPNAGKSALEAWYKEIKDYNYKGEGKGYKDCSQSGVVGHFTQVMWESTTKIGCGFAYRSDGKGISVSCNYSPAGNYGGRQAFDNAAYCKLKNWSENKNKYGEIEWCGSGKCKHINNKEEHIIIKSGLELIRINFKGVGF